MASEHAVQGAVPVEAMPGLRQRAFRFLARVALGLTVAYCVTGLAALQGRMVAEERRLDFPLWVALDDLGIAVLETHVAARAALEAEGPASMSRLKELAEAAAGARSETSLWSDVGEGYRAVYFEGPDPAGGTWLVSSSYIESVDGDGGRVELAASRSVYGKLPDVRNALYGLKRRMDRAAARPLAPAYEVRAVGRPPAGVDAEELARELLRRLGAAAVAVTKAQGEVVAFGYTPRLPGRAERQGTEVNVAVRVTERGMGPWIEVGSPTL